MGEKNFLASGLASLASFRGSNSGRTVGEQWRRPEGSGGHQWRKWEDSLVLMMAIFRHLPLLSADMA